MASVMAMSAIPAINSGSVPGKIIIRGTSKLSLKDRFARLSSEVQQNQAASRPNYALVSAANRRLAQELGNRPEIVSALRFKRKSVMQRLGVRARLGVPAGFRQRVFQQHNGFSPMRRRNFGFGQFAYSPFSPVGFRRPRFGPKRLDGGGVPSNFGFGFSRNGFSKGFRGGNWRMNRGGRRGPTQKERLSREDLDRQLDEYMAKTKAHLDDDLDAYMGETTI